MGKQPSQLSVTDLLSELTKNKPEEVQNEDSGVAQLAKKIKKLNSKNVGILHLLLVIWMMNSITFTLRFLRLELK